MDNGVGTKDIKSPTKEHTVDLPKLQEAGATRVQRGSNVKQALQQTGLFTPSPSTEYCYPDAWNNRWSDRVHSIYENGSPTNPRQTNDEAQTIRAVVEQQLATDHPELEHDLLVQNQKLNADNQTSQGSFLGVVTILSKKLVW